MHRSGDFAQWPISYRSFDIVPKRPVLENHINLVFRRRFLFKESGAFYCLISFKEMLLFYKTLIDGSISVILIKMRV